MTKASTGLTNFRLLKAIYRTITLRATGKVLILLKEYSTGRMGHLENNFTTGLVKTEPPAHCVKRQY